MNMNYLNIFSELPSNFKIIVNKINEDTIELICPKKKLSFITVYTFIFSLAFIGFTCFWTFGSFQAAFFLPLFSIPFWIGGIKLLKGVIVFAFETQILTICKNSITFKREVFDKKEVIEFRIENIQSVELDCLGANIFTLLKSYRILYLFQTRRRGGTLTLPAIKSHGQTVLFFENATDVEQKWITNTIDNFLKQLKTT